jgi:hypothetical protein
MTLGGTMSFTLAARPSSQSAMIPLYNVQLETSTSASRLILASLMSSISLEPVVGISNGSVAFCTFVN